MLVDIDFTERIKQAAELYKEHDLNIEPFAVRHGKGLYSTHALAVDRDDLIVDRFPDFCFSVPALDVHHRRLHRYEDVELRKTVCTNYGVCDSPEQFSALFGAYLEMDERKFIVDFARLTRAGQPAEGGWRWHKNGQYFGRHYPQCEYLADEPEISEVYMFDILQVAGPRLRRVWHFMSADPRIQPGQLLAPEELTAELWADPKLRERVFAPLDA